MVANLHSLTTPQNPAELSERTYSFFAQYIALGLDPKKCTLFVQSMVPEHSELQWLLTCVTPIGNLQRMTQFKEKSGKQKSIQAGLLMYPVLMAADILLYQAKYVPVGEDQKQHLELCRDLVEYFHGKYGEAFTMPEPMIPTQGARIMSLTDPTRKMSKSDQDPQSAIYLLDEPKKLEKKIKKAVTDSGTEVRYSEDSPGIANLMTIYSVLTQKPMAKVEEDFQGKMYGHLKVELAEVVNETLRPFREEYDKLMADRPYLYSLMKAGAERARTEANKTMTNVYEKVGIIS